MDFSSLPSGEAMAYRTLIKTKVDAIAVMRIMCQIK